VRYYLPLHATVLLLFSASTALAQGGGVASPNMGNPGIVDVLEGAGSDRVWSFDIGADWWTIHRAPGPVGAGGAIASRFNDCDYVLQGGGTQTFFKAGAMCSFQGSVRLADAPFVPGAGAALIAANAISVDLEDFVYALAGGGASEFWRYSVSRNQWVRMADLPVAVDDGGSLGAVLSPGGEILAIAGKGTSSVYAYSFVSNRWTQLADAPFTFGEGSTMVSNGGSAAMLVGGGSRAFWAFNPHNAAAMWVPLPDAPGPVSTGSGLVHTNYGNNRDWYAVPGGGSPEVWAFRPLLHMWGGEWSVLTRLPKDNRPPVVNAPASVTVSGCGDCLVRFTIDASGSFDPDGDRMRLEWREGARILAFTPEGVKTGTMQLSGVGAHTITITARDNRGGSSTGTVVVTIEDTAAALREQVAQLQAALAAAQSGHQACEAALTAATATIADAVRVMQTDLATTLNDPAFTIPGSTPSAQLQNIVRAMAGLPRGTKQLLSRALSGQ
jgi:hypothetical protein